MYQQQESQQRNRLNGFLYLELALTMVSLSIAFITFVCCLVNCQIIQQTTTRQIQSCQNFSDVCFQIRTQNQNTASSGLYGIKKKKINTLMQEIELPIQATLNTHQPFRLLCLS